MKDLVLQCMENLGIYVEQDKDNILLEEYIVDSVMYISFIVELEQTFDIEIADEYLGQEKLRTLDDICEMVRELLPEKIDE